VKPRAAKREHGLGDVRVDRLDARTVGAWRKRLPEGSAWHAHKALRQVLSYAVRVKLVSENVAQAVPNPSRIAGRFRPFGAWEEPERVAEELRRPGGRCRSLSPALAFGRRSGWRSSAATST
jgi:hypothetical protein